MARRLRIEYPGALHHVINRGNYRRDLFESVGAAEAFLVTLFEAADKFGWRVHVRRQLDLPVGALHFDDRNEHRSPPDPRISQGIATLGASSDSSIFIQPLRPTSLHHVDLGFNFGGRVKPS